MGLLSDYTLTFEFKVYIMNDVLCFAKFEECKRSFQNKQVHRTTEINIFLCNY